jgi:proteasome lid subunit RPN8/RPN11
VRFDGGTMMRAARRCAPMEACGVVVRGEDGDGIVIEIDNVAKHVGLFEMDSAQLVDVYEKYGDIEGVWHSHPGGGHLPSDEDLECHPSGKMLIIVTETSVMNHGRI